MKQNVLTAVVFVVLIALFAFAANDWRIPGVGAPPHGADWCEAHRTALSTCPTCNPKIARGGTYSVRTREPAEGECPNTLVRIHLAPGVAESVNLAFGVAELREVSETIRANAETMYPPARHAHVTPPLGGIVREVRAILGQDVAAGGTLAVIESPEFGRAKSDHLQAVALLNLRQKTWEQERTLSGKGISTGRELLQATTALEEARLEVRRTSQRLSALGLSPEGILGMVERQETSGMLEIRAPFEGRVVEAAATPGELAAPEKALFEIADMGCLWLEIDVYDADVPKIEKGHRVFFFVEGLPGRRFPGRVVAVGSRVDDRTRTIRVFAEVGNDGGLLRANMFGRAEIAVRPPEPRLLVPKAAVQNDGDCHLVFVSTEPDVFEAREIHVGTVYEGGYEVVGGLGEGDRIVTTGSFLLKTELQRSQMGAG